MNSEILYQTKSEFTSGDDQPTLIANDSLNLADFQQARRKTNRVHNQRRNTGRIIWNEETKQVEIQTDTSIRNTSNDRLNNKSLESPSIISSRSLISRFENNIKDSMPPILRINRSQNQVTPKKPLTTPDNFLIHGINSKKDNNDLLMIKLYEDTKKLIDQLNEKVIRLEKDIHEREETIENLKTAECFEQSIGKGEKLVYERRISELEGELRKIDPVKSDNNRLKEENAALIRVISKLSK